MCQETADLADCDRDEAATRALGDRRRNCEVGVREHGQGDVPVAGVVLANLVVTEAGLVLGGLEAFLDRPTGPGHPGSAHHRQSPDGGAFQAVGKLRLPLAFACHYAAEDYTGAVVSS